MYLLHKVDTHWCLSKCSCTKWAYIDTSRYALLHRICKHRYICMCSGYCECTWSQLWFIPRHVFKWILRVTKLELSLSESGILFHIAPPLDDRTFWQRAEGARGHRRDTSHPAPSVALVIKVVEQLVAFCLLSSGTGAEQQKLFNRIYLAEMWHKMNFQHLTDIILNCISHLKKTLADCWNCCTPVRSFVQYTGEPLWLSASDDGGRTLRLSGNDPCLLLHQHHPHLPHCWSDHRWDSQLQGSQLPTDAYQHLKSPKPHEFTFLKTLKNNNCKY